jgi:hypothetical protein
VPNQKVGWRQRLQFIAWQGGSKYKVRVNAAGNITGVTPL